MKSSTAVVALVLTCSVNVANAGLISFGIGYAAGSSGSKSPSSAQDQPFLLSSDKHSVVVCEYGSPTSCDTVRVPLNRLTTEQCLRFVEPREKSLCTDADSLSKYVAEAEFTLQEHVQRAGFRRIISRGVAWANRRQFHVLEVE